MKKTRKLLSIVLSLLVVFGSLPVVYTAAADAVTFAAGETGTIDNPTHPVSADGVFSYDDLYKLNIDVENTKYTFYQTMNDEYFTYTQILGLQQRNDVPVSGRTFNFVGVEHYTGGTNATTSNADGSAQGTDLLEVPAITTNTTSEFLNTYYVPTHTWAAINSNASGLSSTPSNVQLQGSSVDLTGCKNYSWSDTYVVKGHSASTTGEINTGYYEAYKWNWSTEDASAAFELRLKTSIRILDARKLAEELAKAEDILANPEKYTDAYISSVQATVNTIPEDLRDFSTVYDQSVIDKYTEMLENVSLNSADYREFNETYEMLSSITNAKGAFTDDSFAAFKAEIERINQELPKNLDYTKQDTVDQATQALKNAYNILVSTDLSDSNTGANYTTNEDDGDMSFTIDNTVFKFMQTKDNQVFEYSQMWTIKRSGGNTDRNFGGMILQTADNTVGCDNSTCRLNQVPATNNTAAFVSRLTSDSVATITANNEVGTSVTAPEFLCWTEHTDATGTTSKDTTIIDTEGSYVGALDSNRDYAYDTTTYYLKNTPKFTGNPAGTYGAISTNYVLRTGWNYKTGGFLGIGTTKHYSHIHINNTIEITDVRQLIAAVTEANATIANPGSYSDSYISALQAAVDSVPIELLRGIEYYTQEEVDAYLNTINSVQEGCADYTEFNKAFEELANMKNDSTYTDESFNAFMDEIYEINKNLPKDLPASEQATVDAATEALHKATHTLVYYKLNTDNVFTEEDIPEDLGFSPLVFSVSSTRYEFMQVSDGQQFAIRTDFSARNNDSSYTLRLLSFGFSTVNADNVTAICDARETPDKGCHNVANVPSKDFFDLATYASTSGTITGITSYTADDAGDTGEFNSWVNTDGVNLSSGGVFIDGAELELYDSTGYATYVYTATSDAAQANININYAFRLGWSYEQFWGETIRRHAHIPVSLSITDARALHNLYNEVEDILNGETDKSYTLSSLVTLYNAFNNVPADMASGEAYYTQSDVNTKYDELKAAYDTLVEGADYSEFFEAYVKAQEIIDTNNKDSAGNSLYDDTAYDTFNQQFTDIITNLDMNLPASEQTTVNDATTALNNALAALEATKRADYSEFNDALAEVEKILKEEQENPGTYTQSSLEAIQNAYNDAVALDKELPASEQGTVDAVTEALKAAAENKKYKADYSEFDDVYSQVQDIVNNPDKYTDATVDAAEKALEEADKLNKDLPDTADNRTTIENATNDLQSVIDGAQNKANYDGYDDAYAELEKILDNKDNYTQDTVDAAQAAKDAADALGKDQPATNQDAVNQVIAGMQNVVTNAQTKADYTDYNDKKADADAIIDAGNVDENGNTVYDETAFEAYKEAVNKIDTELSKDLPSSEQTTVDNAAAELDNLKATLENNKKADYTDFNTAKDALEEIVNNPDKYTDATVDAAQEALDNANMIPDNMVVGENNANQNIIDAATNAMEQVIANRQEKANYDGYDDAYAELENILNNKDNYTQETVDAAQAAKDAADALGKDQPATNQDAVNEVIAGMQNVVTNAQEKANYDAYNNAKAEADAIINSGNVDENGNPIYDEAVFEAYKEAVNKIDSELIKDLPSSEQTTVDNAVAELESLKATLESKKYYTVTFKDVDGNVLGTSSYVNGDVFGNLTAPALPEDTDTIAYVGWVYADGTLAKADDVVSGDMDVTVASEAKKLIAKDESGVTIDEITSFVSGIEAGTTVEEVLSKFDNDELVIEIKTYEGVELASEELVGTGSTITLKSKYTGVVYETRMFIIMGDVDGDGDIDDTDFEISKSVGFESYTYPDEHNYFFIANDIDENGIINVLDAFYIGRMKTV